MTASITRDLIIEKLSTVYDPEIPVNICELVCFTIFVYVA